MKPFNRSLRVARLTKLNKPLGEFARLMVCGHHDFGGDWKPAPRGNNLYWARVLVCSVGLDYRLTEPLRRELQKWVPSGHRCYEGHTIPKDTHPHDCSTCRRK